MEETDLKRHGYGGRTLGIGIRGLTSLRSRIWADGNSTRGEKTEGGESFLGDDLCFRTNESRVLVDTKKHPQGFLQWTGVGKTGTEKGRQGHKIQISEIP